tara:strand:+ start:645 stop:1031 length:387 start_codon:yes stop_codon:yes gene_type:complete
MSTNEANIKNFNDDLEKFIVATGVTVDKGVRTIAMRLYNGITQMTPVDTGRAKGNWNMGIGQPDLSINEGARQKQNFNLKIGDGLKTIYITNNLPYINTLEYGNANRQPVGMVKITMNNIKVEIANVI